jgi:drug/metabolite transporter (DMT)-like permease
VSSSGGGRPTQAPQGIAFMLGGVAAMISLDVTAKWLLQSYGLNQLVLLRCLFSVVLITWWALGRGGLAELATRRPGWHVLRSLLMAGSMFAFFHALRRIPLADVMTLAFAAPLVVTALSRPLLGEHVGPWRWAAVIIGFGGVLVVLRPGQGLGDPAALIALAGAGLYALLSLSARRLSVTESTASLSLYLFAVPLAIAVAGAGTGWIPPRPLDWLLFAACGSFGGLAFILMNAAYRRAPAALLVPFEYTGLIWAAGAGYWIWDEVPAATTWAGAVLIIASGLLILYRETATRRAQPQADFPLQDAVVVAAEQTPGAKRD